MRLRKRKNLDSRLESCGKYFMTSVGEPLNMKEAAAQKAYFDFENMFGNGNPIHLEIGCGCGKFACDLAERNKNINVVAVEKNINAIIKGCERAKQEGIENLRFFQCRAECIERYFPPQSVERIYLNFSCPYPKKQQANRRLTGSGFLQSYKEILAQEGEIYQKTDNMGFFEFSLEQFSQNGFCLKNISLDLHSSAFSGNIMTEYEEKFVSRGMRIYRLEAYLK